MIKRLQPWALIGSNHNNLPHPGEDFIPFEGFVRPANVPLGRRSRPANIASAGRRVPAGRHDDSRCDGKVECSVRGIDFWKAPRADRTPSLGRDHHQG